MLSSADGTFWNTVGDWHRLKSQVRVRFATLPRDFSFDAEVMDFVVGVSVTFKNTETGEACEPLDLFHAIIRLSSLPYPTEKTKGSEELKFGAVFNITWEDEKERRCTLSEIRDFATRH